MAKAADTANGSSKESRYLSVLSTLLFDRTGSGKQPSAEYSDALTFVDKLHEENLRELFDLADSHHVTVRVIQTLQQAGQSGGNLRQRLDPLLT